VILPNALMLGAMATALLFFTRRLIRKTLA
jgi:hypothetical protein